MKARFAFFCAVAAAAVLAACGGGGGGGGGTPPTNPPATATPTPTVAPTGPVTGSVVFGGTATSAPLPSSVGATGTVSIPAGSGTANYTFATAAPTGGPPAILARTRASATSNNGVIYLTMTAQGNVTIDGVPGFSATPSGSGPPAGTVFYVAYYGEPTGQTPAAQSAAWVSSSATGATLTSGTLTIPATTSPVFTLTAGQSVYFVLYYGYYIPPINNFGCVGVQGNGAQRQLVGVQPPTAGSSWNYTGTLTDVIARSSPCPVPTASSAATVSVAVTVAPTTGPLAGTDVDEHSVESDAYATHTTQVTTDAIVNGTSESSELSTDLSGNTVATTYVSPYLTYASASNFTNSAPSTVNTTFVDGTTYARTYGALGTYTETDALAGITTHNTITTNSDGSASYNVYNGFSGTSIAFTMGAPAGGNIVFTVNSGGTPQTLTIPQWFGPNPTLYSDATTVTTATLDASCVNTGNVLGSGSATEYLRTISTLDPALGYTETETIKSYVVPNYTAGKTVGPVCVVIGDTQNLYYDYLFDTPYLVYISANGQPVQTSTLNETYYFSSAPVGESRVRPAAAAMTDGNLALQASGFAYRRAVERAQRIEAFERAVSQGQFKGVVR